MPERSMRFGVVNAAGKRAATWKCWSLIGVGKSDVYLACRPIGQAIKVSFHETGQWHIAYEYGFFSENVGHEGSTNQDRFIDKWQRPEEVVPGLTMAVRILTPWSAIKTPYDPKQFKKMRWIQNVDEDTTTEILVMICSSCMTYDLSVEGLTKVDSMKLDNGETILVGARVIEIPPATGEGLKGQFYKSKSNTDLQSRDLRAFAISVDANGTREIWDTSVQRLGRENQKQ